MQTKEASNPRKERKQRVPLSAANKLMVRGKEAGYHYRIVNDRDDRVQMFIDAGYEPVSGEGTKVERSDGASEMGSVKTFPVGGGDKAVLMRIPQEWYDEDQELKQKRIDELEQTSRQEALSGNGQFSSKHQTYGK